MAFRYLPMTDDDRKEMLEEIGVQTVDELFADIPESVRFKGRLKLKEAKPETELYKELANLARKNADVKSYTSFLGLAL